MPLVLVLALSNILSVKRLTTTSSASGALSPTAPCPDIHAPPTAPQPLGGAPVELWSFSVSNR
jgi:hypothetical protein